MENQEAKEIVAKIKRFMFAHGMTQRGIASTGIISYTYLNNILTGKKLPSERMIYKFEEFFKSYENQDNQ